MKEVKETKALLEFIRKKCQNKDIQWEDVMLCFRHEWYKKYRVQVLGHPMEKVYGPPKKSVNLYTPVVRRTINKEIVNESV